MRDSGETAFELVIGERRWPLVAGVALTVGRDAQAEVRVDHSEVSRRHAVVASEAGVGWVLRDVGSVNGLVVDGRRVEAIRLQPGVRVRLGPSDSAPELTVVPAGPDASDRLSLTDPRRAATVIATEARTAALTIGRAVDNDVVVDDLLASRHHARATPRGHGFWIEDLGSLNGTYVNGASISAALVGPGDLLTIGHLDFAVVNGELRMAPQRREVSLVAVDLRVVLPGGKQLLGGVGFALPAASLLAVIGPSGAGKSTLLGALTGSRKASSGQVFFDGRDLYANYHELRHRIGVVPQDDVVHRQLTVRQALGYASRLRFPADLDPAAREARIEAVLAELELAQHADTRIDRLSGGQRKRASVALELMTEPSLLFLDEPTSGLDPSLDKSVMTTLRNLADGGRTVVVVTHSVANLGMCDRVLLLAPGGTVAFFGPPDQVLPFFGRDDYSDIFADVAAHPEAVTEAFARHIALAPSDARPVPSSRDDPRVAPPLRQQPLWVQAWTLTRRHVRVLLSDRSYAAFMVVLPIMLALLALTVQGDAGFGAPVDATLGEQLQLLVIIVVGAAFMGMAASARDLVGERAIFRREKGVGLSTVAYLAAKLLVFGAVTAIQAALLVGLVLLVKEGPDSAAALGNGSLELYLAVATTAFCSAMFGLVISAAVSSSDQTMPLIVVSIMAQLVLCGGLIAVDDRPGLEQLAWLTPARWGYSAAMSTINVDGRATPRPDALWEHTAGNWFLCVGMLGALTVVAVLATSLLLRRVGAEK